MIESPKRVSLSARSSDHGQSRGGCDIGSLTRLRKKKKVSLGYKLGHRGAAVRALVPMIARL